MGSQSGPIDAEFIEELKSAWCYCRDDAAILFKAEIVERLGPDMDAATSSNGVPRKRLSQLPRD
jgi:hypothetical protein